MVPNMRHAIILTNSGLFNLRVYASLGLNELKNNMVWIYECNIQSSRNVFFLPWWFGTG